MTDVLPKLVDLLKQATNERSHYYVAACCREAIEEIVRLRVELELAAERHARFNKAVGELAGMAAESADAAREGK